MTTPLKKIAEEKNRNYQSSLKGGGGGGYPPLVKDQYISVFFFQSPSTFPSVENQVRVLLVLLVVLVVVTGGKQSQLLVRLGLSC